MTKFSVILSIYNVEDYLDRCIKSIVNQKYKNLEIILVDDGATDSSGDICEAWKKKDERILVIHKKNEGLGMARNTGLANATGDYVCFFDSDDFIINDLFSDAVKIIEENSPDLIEFGHVHLNSELETIAEFVPKISKDVFQGDSIVNMFLPELICTDPKTGKASDLMMSAWCALYKKETLDNTDFSFVSERDYICEDVYSLMRWIPKINKVCIMKKAYYCYCDNKSSLTHSYKADRFKRIIQFQQDLNALCNTDVYTSEIRSRINRPFLDNVQACMKMETENRTNSGFLRTYKNIRMICSNTFFRDALKLTGNTSFTRNRRILNTLIINKQYLMVYFLLIFQAKR